MSHKLLHLFLLSFMLLTGGLQTMTAADYVVYSATGEIHTYDKNGKKQPVRACQTLAPQTRISIGAESALTILDQQGSKMYSLTEQGISSVRELVNSTKGTKNLSKQYLSYMVKQLFASGSSDLSHPSTYMQSTATSYRATSQDSLLTTRLASMMPSASESVESQLVKPSVAMESDFDVRFELMDCTTRQPIGKNIAAGTPCYVRIYNGSPKGLYMNVLNIDPQGGKYLVLPVDKEATCAHLYVPAHCTLSFRSEPFEFGNAGSRETFLLVATEEPVDFSILMNPIRAGKPAKGNLGAYRITYLTH